MAKIRSKHKNHTLLFGTLIILITVGESVLSSEKRDKIDTFVNSFLECEGIPGLSLVIAHEGEVVYARGYGKTSLDEEHGPIKDVDSQTLFNIGSTTKAFTTLLLAEMLHINKSFTWNTPIKQILPQSHFFRDNYRIREATLRDLAAHKVGVPRHDLQWLLDKWSRDELMERIKFFDPVLPFRTQLLYNNNMYAVLGYIAEKLSGDGKSWEELTTELVFKPLNMTSSTFMNLVEDYRVFAVPYMGNQITKVPIDWSMYSGTRSTGPAGGIASNAEDMGMWLLFLLGHNSTDPNFERVKETFLNEVFFTDPISLKPYAPETLSINDIYARGWMKGYHRGYRVLQHAGDFTGFAAQVFLIPDIYYGSYSAMNFPDNGIQRKLLHVYISDIVLGNTPWFNISEVCEGTSVVVNVKSPPNDVTGVDQDLFFTAPTDPKSYTRNMPIMDSVTKQSRHSFAEYVGEFGNFAYGNVSIRLSEGSTALHMEYGRNGLFNLIPSLVGEDTFTPVGIGSPSNLFSLGTISFGRSDKGGIVNTLYIPVFERLDPPTFIKDLKQSDALKPYPC